VALELRLEPKPEASSISVEIQARGQLGKYPSWHIALGESGDLADPTARDQKGNIPVVLRNTSPGVELSFGRIAEGDVVVSYRVAGHPFSDDVLAVAIDPNRMRVSGERLVALPEDVPEKALAVSIAINPLPFTSEARAASSFGVGNTRHTQASPGALRRATYIAGPMGQAILDGPEGQDEVAWLGYTSFDPRSIAAEVAAFRSASREYFGEKASAQFTLLIVPDSRLPGRFDVARRTQSVLLHVGAGQVYNGPLRVTVSHQLLREWMGSVLYVGPMDPSRSAEAVWFTDGVTRYLARELDFRFGLLSSAEYVAEVEELERIVATSPLASKSNAELARVKTPAALALAVARGARHAADVDARIRKKHAGKKSLDQVLRGLYAEARKIGGPLADDSWSRALEAELGPDAAASFAHVSSGKVLSLPSDALGKCFVPEPRRYEAFSLGYELDSNATSPRVLVVPGGPAERAGVKSGDRIVKVFHQPEDPSVPVKLELEREGKKLNVEYRPVGKVIPGTGFRRVGKHSDAECVR
jgi:predicted metalloprotease with PDZ domain